MADENGLCHIQMEEGGICGQPGSLQLMEELRVLYKQRIDFMDSHSEGGCTELKVKTLESMVKELGDLNSILVETVAQLEREAIKYVRLFERHLNRSSKAAQGYMAQLGDFDGEATRDVRKTNSYDHVREQNESYKREIFCLKKDVESLITLLHRVREDGSWNVDDLQFCKVSLADIFGADTKPLPGKFRRSGSPPPLVEPDQEMFCLDKLHIEKLNAELMALRCSRDEAAMFSAVKEDEIKKLNEELHSLKEELLMKDDELEKFRRNYEACNIAVNTESPLLKDVEVMTLTNMSELKKSEAEVSMWKDRALALEAQVITVQSEMRRNEEDIVTVGGEMETLTRQLREVQEKYFAVSKENQALTENLESRIMELKDKSNAVELLKQEIKELDESARDMRAALTAEVAEKHDCILSLRRDNQTLEEQLREANMQTHFKDDILKEMRKDLKILRARLLSVDPSCKDLTNNGLRYMSCPQVSGPIVTTQQKFKCDKGTQWISEEISACATQKVQRASENLCTSNESQVSEQCKVYSRDAPILESRKNFQFLSTSSQNVVSPTKIASYSGAMGDMTVDSSPLTQNLNMFSYDVGPNKVRLRQVGKRHNMT